MKMKWLLRMASMKPRSSANQLLWALALVDVVELTEVLQLLQPKKESSWLILCSAMPLHHVNLSSSTSASLVLLLFIGGRQNIHTCRVSLRKWNKTVP